MIKMIDKECYVCKKHDLIKHDFYDELCVECGELSFMKRNQTANLKGYTALVTGARIKIGYEASLKLLRSGAKVLITTRFPNDALLRYSREKDFNSWKEMLYIYTIDLRLLSSIESFIHFIKQEFNDINIIINNAAQTIRRPPIFYKHLLQNELTYKTKEINKILSSGNKDKDSKLISGVPLDLYNIIVPFDKAYNKIPAELTQIPLLKEDLDFDLNFFPKNVYDKDGQQEDRRPENSWSMNLSDINLIEFIEVLYINTVAPFLFNSKLRELLASKKTPSYIINVSAMEGNFNREDKSIRHPHTNMAKAALNMMTRTSASDYAEDLIYMNSVDVGYITNEKPFPLDVDNNDRIYKMPLDEIDGAARICDPIFEGVNNKNYIYGQFLKNFNSHPW
ncbi:MAG: hypothetical protein A2046_14635 [Bacteroidetes bacterium GWA2_30_7]|nr:MAG: hypothetical protein A2046_14635 [Bacteroidetes bacterium GWA2_30_7]